jgi:hypothetical protein
VQTCCSLQVIFNERESLVIEIKAQYFIDVFLSSPSLWYLSSQSLAFSGFNKKRNMIRATFFTSQLNPAKKSDQPKNLIRHRLRLTARHTDIFCVRGVLNKVSSCKLSSVSFLLQQVWWPWPYCLKIKNSTLLTTRTRYCFHASTYGHTYTHTQLLTYLLTYSLTHSLTHSLHGAGFFLRS